MLTQGASVADYPTFSVYLGITRSLVFGSQILGVVETGLEARSAPRLGDEKTKAVDIVAPVREGGEPQVEVDKHTQSDGG